MPEVNGLAVWKYS